MIPKFLIPHFDIILEFGMSCLSILFYRICLYFCCLFQMILGKIKVRDPLLNGFDKLGMSVFFVVGRNQIQAFILVKPNYLLVFFIELT